MYTVVLFLLDVSDLSLQIQTFPSLPFHVFVVTNYLGLCCKFVGDLSCSFVTFCFFVFRITRLSISCNRVFLVINSLSFCMSGKVFMSPSDLQNSSAGYIIPG